MRPLSCFHTVLVLRVGRCVCVCLCVCVCVGYFFLPTTPHFFWCKFHRDDQFIWRPDSECLLTDPFHHHWCVDSSHCLWIRGKGLIHTCKVISTMLYNRPISLFRPRQVKHLVLVRLRNPRLNPWKKRRRETANNNCFRNYLLRHQTENTHNC